VRKLLAVFAFVAMGVSLAIASGIIAKEVTVKGEVIDLPCYEGKGGVHGEEHRQCAIACAKKGNQLAILEDGTNTVYVITGNYSANKNEKLIPFVAEKVEAKGEVTEKDGKRYLNITSIKKLESK
jgi:hypothetical protein